MPTADGFMSPEAKIDLANVALALRDEQLEAKVVHYKVELETSPELDAITAQVIQELQTLQAAAKAKQPAPSRPPAADRASVERELVQTLTDMLGRVFRPGKLATIIERKLGEVSKRFARIFFESELHDRIRGKDDEAKAMRYAEQALYHALTHCEPEILLELDSFQYVGPAVLRRAKEQYHLHVKELRNQFLARSTPELNMLVKYLNEVLTAFFTNELPPALNELARQVIREAKLAEANTVSGYKISASAFPKFRGTFERLFLQRLVPFVEDEMLKRVRDTMSQFRTETLQFVADPAIFMNVCEVICDSVYDMLYNDGFLDLPNDWRARLSAEG